ncbi:hypothetical protein [Gemmatimonas groenlandica]|uniref:Lipoprotein n=1 Tax=Gemmatimonas groenlandica TaxID=2732249 RepID=A0A6M4IR48_9BACT|nr:hypothetical protein [Gemmatimonas groenlandica]QJR35856.1 hypothetical protein HKW67_10205 [Gemmatimonas groenlandica]
MRQYIRSSRPTMILAAFSLAALAACGDKAADNASLNADSTLGRDLAMATDSAQPKLEDVPVTPPPGPRRRRAGPGPEAGGSSPASDHDRTKAVGAIDEAGSCSGRRNGCRGLGHVVPLRHE